MRSAGWLRLFTVYIADGASLGVVVDKIVYADSRHGLGSGNIEPGKRQCVTRGEECVTNWVAPARQSNSADNNDRKGGRQYKYVQCICISFNV